MQFECFSQEIEFLSSHKKGPIPSLVNSLNLFIDKSGILRSQGRISKCLFFSYDACNPVLLGKDHKLTQLIIMDCHLKLQHLGLQTTLQSLRTKGYWIPKARQCVKKTISMCMVCKKFNSFSFQYPKFTNMPKHHMNLVKPYMHVGLDYTGHIWVSETTTSKMTKMYILIFTCLNVRAIHLELIPDMSSCNFLLAYQRFCNLYTTPSYIYSDNAKTFINSGDILRDALVSEEFIENLRACNTQHVRIPLYSAWVGAAWERLIRTVKSCLHKVVGRAKLNYFQLLTTLSNIQNAINSRPLTYRSSENELDIITPNSFIKFHSNPVLILPHTTDDWIDDSCQNRLEKTLEVQEEMYEEFRKLWYENYLTSLREHSRNLYQSHWSNRLKVGDVVLIKLPNKPRPFWMLGRVLQIFIGFDNKIRSVKLKQGNGVISNHSICHLYPLELSITHNAKENLTEEESTEEDVVKIDSDCKEDAEILKEDSKRPVRQSALKFKQFMKENLKDL